MLSNIPPAVATMIIKVVFSHHNGAAFGTILDAFPEAPERHRLQRWLGALVEAGMLEVDRTTNPPRYFATHAGWEYAYGGPAGSSRQSGNVAGMAAGKPTGDSIAVPASLTGESTNTPVGNEGVVLASIAGTSAGREKVVPAPKLVKEVVVPAGKESALPASVPAPSAGKPVDAPVQSVGKPVGNSTGVPAGVPARTAGISAGNAMPVPGNVPAVPAGKLVGNQAAVPGPSAGIPVGHSMGVPAPTSCTSVGNRAGMAAGNAPAVPACVPGPSVGIAAGNPAAGSMSVFGTPVGKDAGNGVGIAAGNSPGVPVSVPAPEASVPADRERMEEAVTSELIEKLVKPVVAAALHQSPVVPAAVEPVPASVPAPQAGSCPPAARANASSVPGTVRAIGSALLDWLGHVFPFTRDPLIRGILLPLIIVLGLAASGWVALHLWLTAGALVLVLAAVLFIRWLRRRMAARTKELLTANDRNPTAGPPPSPVGPAPGVTAVASEATPPARVSEPPARARGSRLPAVMVALGGVVLGAVIVGVVWYRNSDEGRVMSDKGMTTTLNAERLTLNAQGGAGSDKGTTTLNAQRVTLNGAGSDKGRVMSDKSPTLGSSIPIQTGGDPASAQGHGGEAARSPSGSEQPSTGGSNKGATTLNAQRVTLNGAGSDKGPTTLNAQRVTLNAQVAAESDKIQTPTISPPTPPVDRPPTSPQATNGDPASSPGGSDYDQVPSSKNQNPTIGTLPPASGAIRNPVSEIRNQYPSAPGAYVLIDGTWRRLPRNNGRNVQTYADSVSMKLISAELEPDAAAGRASTLSTVEVAHVAFNGTDPVPTISARDVVLVYVGKLTSVPPETLAKYPLLRTYPAIELARVSTAKGGVRQAPLVLVAPGFIGFGSARVNATVEQPQEGVAVLRVAAPLAPGRYAFACGPEAYELMVE